MLRIVNMIPQTLSGETNQDSEPNIAVDPGNRRHIVATAFTPDPLNGPRAPIFVSTDGGRTWQLHSIVPGGPSTRDITVGFASRGGTLYAGILNFSDVHLNVLRTADPFSVTPITTGAEEMIRSPRCLASTASPVSWSRPTGLSASPAARGRWARSGSAQTWR